MDISSESLKPCSPRHLEDAGTLTSMAVAFQPASLPTRVTAVRNSTP